MATLRRTKMVGTIAPNLCFYIDNQAGVVRPMALIKKG